MSIGLEGVGFQNTESIPPWQSVLSNLNPKDQRDQVPEVQVKFAKISKMFDDLSTPPLLLDADRRSELYPPALKDVSGLQSEKGAASDAGTPHPHFTYGVDYLFGRNKGKPLDIDANAALAIYQGKQGVEKWRIMKSVAFKTLNKGVILVHTRGDREVDTAALASKLGLQENELVSLNEEELMPYGVARGTVSPFVTAPDVHHVFDQDLLEHKDSSDRNKVLTTAGDARFYVAFDIQRYLEALSAVDANRVPWNVTREKPNETQRLIANRRVIVIGGDSGIDTDEFSKSIKDAVIKLLGDQSHGDRSGTKMTSESDPNLAGSIDTAVHGKELREIVKKISEKIQASLDPNKPKPLVTFRSFAMHGIAGDILRGIPGIEYVGPEEAVERKLSEMEEEGAQIDHTILLGLPSMYDEKTSAFTGRALNNTMKVNNNAQKLLQDFIADCKERKQKPADLFKGKKEEGNEKVKDKGIFDIIFRQFGGGDKAKIEGLKGKNIAIILGASELERVASELARYAGMDQETKKLFRVVIDEPNYETPAARLVKTMPHDEPRDESTEPRINLTFIKPGEELAQLIAQKTLGLEA